MFTPHKFVLSVSIKKAKEGQPKENLFGPQSRLATTRFSCFHANNMKRVCATGFFAWIFFFNGDPKGQPLETSLTFAVGLHQPFELLDRCKTLRTRIHQLDMSRRKQNLGGGSSELTVFGPWSMLQIDQIRFALAADLSTRFHKASSILSMCSLT